MGERVGGARFTSSYFSSAFHTSTEVGILQKKIRSKQLKSNYLCSLWHGYMVTVLALIRTQHHLGLGDDSSRKLTLSIPLYMLDTGAT